MFRRLRLPAALILAAASLGLTACVAVMDRDGSGLNPPPGGWDHHGPG